MISSSPGAPICNDPHEGSCTRPEVMEAAPLLDVVPSPDSDDDYDVPRILEEFDAPDSSVSPSIRRRLFISHFLSTWNTRVFEFGAVLFLASIFPNTLLPMSVYALTRGAAAIALSPAVGHYIDTGNRLRVVRFSIGS